MKRKKSDNITTRRKFLGVAGAGLASAAILPPGFGASRSWRVAWIAYE